MKLKQPIFICGCHKSGTSLLRALLDGHPDLTVLPYESHAFPLMGYWFEYPLVQSTPYDLQDYDATRGRYIELAKLVNQYSNQVSETDLRGRIDIEKFIRAFPPQDTWKSLLMYYFKAMHQSTTEDAWEDSKRIVEKSVENHEAVDYYRLLFPDAKFLHIIRNPYANLVSMRRSEQFKKTTFPYLLPYIRGLRNHFYWALRNMNVLPAEQYMIVRYEGLLETPSATMQVIAKFLGIPFQPTLTIPTVLGELWEGNSSTGIKFQGINADNVTRWKDAVSSLEIFLINKFLDFALAIFEYDREEPRHNWRWPAKWELPHKYLANRSILKLNRRG